MLKILGQVTGLTVLKAKRQARAEQEAQEAENEEKERAYVRRREALRLVHGIIMKYPEKEFTAEELAVLPAQGDEGVDLQSLAVDTWFRFQPIEGLGQVNVVGHIVEFKDRLLSQIGGGMMGDQCGFSANRYRVKIKPNINNPQTV